MGLVTVPLHTEDAWWSGCTLTVNRIEPNDHDLFVVTGAGSDTNGFVEMHGELGY